MPAGPVYLRIIVHKCDVFSHGFLRIVKRSSIHRLHLGFVNVFIAPIGLS